MIGTNYQTVAVSTNRRPWQRDVVSGYRMSEDGLHFELTGPGPFELPLLAKFVGAIAPDHKDWVIAEFQSQDGSTLYVPISNQAVASLAETLSALLAVDPSNGADP